MELDLQAVLADRPTFPIPPGTSIETLLNGYFSSIERVQEVLKAFRTQIVQKLIPGLDKPGYEERYVIS